MHKRGIYNDLIKRLKEPRRFIQALLGPRQVGKTSLAMQVAQDSGMTCHYASADLATLQDLSWIRQQWDIARAMGPETVLMIDEVQKIPHWSDLVKSLWDEDTRKNRDIRVMLLGSSPWLVQKGLSESLAGRFEVIPITHWSLAEMEKHFEWGLDHFVYFGGYPGAVPLTNEADSSRWINYINDSLIETTISRDILLLAQVNKPALLRRLFQLGCTYSGQILSYNKMVGQLQDAGNTTTLAHYLELLCGAGLLAGIPKYRSQAVRQRASSPKFMVYNTALMSAQSGRSFQEAREDHAFWGRLIESAIGAHLLNSIRGTQIKLFYWREKDNKVDFVLNLGDQLIALEVKSNHEGLGHKGTAAFVEQFHPQRVVLVGDQGIGIETFLKTPVIKLFQ